LRSRVHSVRWGQSSSYLVKSSNTVVPVEWISQSWGCGAPRRVLECHSGAPKRGAIHYL